MTKEMRQRLLAVEEAREEEEALPVKAKEGQHEDRERESKMSESPRTKIIWTKVS